MARVTVKESLAFPAQKVWELVSDFGNVSWFQGLAKSEVRGQGPGMVRLIYAGDGPAIFIIMIAGFIVVGAALFVEMKYQPPFWVHAALWGPLILATTLLPLRSMKALLIDLQYFHKAAEGQLVKRESK